LLTTISAVVVAVGTSMGAAQGTFGKMALLGLDPLFFGMLTGRLHLVGSLGYKSGLFPFGLSPITLGITLTPRNKTTTATTKLFYKRPIFHIDMKV